MATEYLQWGALVGALVMYTWLVLFDTIESKKEDVAQQVAQLPLGLSAASAAQGAMQAALPST